MGALDEKGVLRQVADEHSGGLVDDLRRVSNDFRYCRKEAKTVTLCLEICVCFCTTPMADQRSGQPWLNVLLIMQGHTTQYITNTNTIGTTLLFCFKSHRPTHGRCVPNFKG